MDLSKICSRNSHIYMHTPLIRYRDSISTCHFPFQLSHGFRQLTCPRQNWFHLCYHSLSLLLVLFKPSAQAITAVCWE
jgi:hypothetical protein